MLTLWTYFSETYVMQPCPLGGKIIVLGGDFRQVLPVVPRKSQREAVNASLVSSIL